MNFSEYYKLLLSEIENYIEETTTKMGSSNLYEPVRYILSAGGKRIRPVLALLAAEVAGGSRKEALSVATAVEILHNYTLVHDDIMDKSNFRRGRETVHIRWDEATAILTGDIMIAKAYEQLPSNHPRFKEIFELFTRAFVEVNEGQALDMFFNEKRDADFNDYLDMVDKKTAALIKLPLLLGAHIALADETTLKALEKYAYFLGIAFQVQDDYLDMTADEKELGKKTGLDIVEGKKTCLIIKANQKELQEDARSLMDKFYEENGLSFEYVPQIDALFKEYGVYEEILILIDELFKKAEEALESIENKHSEAITMLKLLLFSLNKRRK